MGGRAKGVAADGAHELELGATWFWADMQPELTALFAELGVPTFDQPTGRLLVEAHQGEPAWAFDYPYVDGQRVAGGMSALARALASRLDKDKIKINQKVESVSLLSDGISVKAQSDEFAGGQILLAVPPRLAVSTIAFTPSLPEKTADEWANTATWMAPHAKFIAQYERPFWRDKGLSGDARSQVGPLAEIHDISAEAGSFGALFGFVGVPFATRKQAGEEALLKLCQAQLVRLYGKQAANPVAVYFKDWAADPLTATEADHRAAHTHPDAPTAAVTGEWQDRLTGIASEFSPNFSGYLAGAVEAARLAVAGENV